MLKLKKMVWVGSLIGTLLVSIATMAGADVIYEQDLNQVDNLGFVSNITGDLSADNFVISTPSTIQSIIWYGMYAWADEKTEDTFDIRLSTLSGAQLFSSLGITNASKSDSGFVDAFGETIYQYEVSIADWELTSNEYLISISNSNTDFSDWFWADSLGGDGTSFYGVPGAWTEDTSGYEMAFTLNGVQSSIPTTPEPNSILLLGLGVGVFAYFQRTGLEIS